MDRPRVEWLNQEGKWTIQAPLEDELKPNICSDHISGLD